MDFDWKKVIGAAAPILTGLATGGPVGMGIGALKAIADVLGVEPTEDAISAVAQVGLTPEQRMALAAQDGEVKKALIAAGVREKELVVESEKANLADIEDARAHNANTVGILRLGYFINVASYLCVAGVLGGAFYIMANSVTFKVDPNTAMMFGSLIGSALQWLLSNAAQSNGFFFGSSPSSRQSASEVAKATSMITQKAAEKV